MFKEGLIIPALIGLGLFAQSNELSLCNNTTILLMLVMLIQDHVELEEVKCRQERLEKHCCNHHEGIAELGRGLLGLDGGGCGCHRRRRHNCGCL